MIPLHLSNFLSKFAAIICASAEGSSSCNVESRIISDEDNDDPELDGTGEAGIAVCKLKRKESCICEVLCIYTA